MNRVTLELPYEIYNALVMHLLPVDSALERAGFILVKGIQSEGNVAFQFVEWIAIDDKELVYSSEYGLELTDRTKARIIKRAYDLDASLVECHSHPFQRVAQFSETDMDGLLEFVPHVWWRLKGKPYIAFVFARAGFDALTWISDPKTPEMFNSLIVGRKLYQPTGFTFNQINIGGRNGYSL